MTQNIVVQVGQCGNQIGCRFWDLALREHAMVNKNGIFDEPLSSFFRNVDTRCDDPVNIPLADGTKKIGSLKARAVLVDMEEGVVTEALKGPLREVFDFRQLITDVSGSGNNWAVGHKMYGSKYREEISETIRHAAEFCDCLQCFFVMHSMGGGTGSGLGTFVLELLKDDYPEVYRFVTAVYPSAEDDVITSPYNSVLAMRQLTENADCVLPIENQALMDIVNKITHAIPSANTGKRTYTSVSGNVKAKSAVTIGDGGLSKPKDEKPFDGMNNIVANLLLNMTRLDQMFTDAFSRDHQLIRADPKHSTYLAAALMLRGSAELSDIRRNINKLNPSLKFIYWNKQGWKTGLCSVPPVGQPYSLLTLANNCCIRHTFTELRERFVKLYNRKAHVHHYTHVEGMDVDDFTQSLESLESIIHEYEMAEKQTERPANAIPRLRIAT